MSKIKIFNDPIYGLISFPFEIVYTLIDHPYFQRLRRIGQVGLSSYVYPGATHTRFHHAIGATHLADVLVRRLIDKGVGITKEEHEACLLATLLHDVGHGPFSHALEFVLVDIHHEELTLQIMHRLNIELNGDLELAIQIFIGTYHKKFLKSIISSQLDVDRLDYLNRDSYYTGVAEGIIGYERIIEMLNVHDGVLVVEEKGLHSVEKFIISRHLMYHQVYLHKTSISAEQMLISFMKRVKNEGVSIPFSQSLSSVLACTNKADFDLDAFVLLDDHDIYSVIKHCRKADDLILRFLASSLLDRKLFKTEISDQGFTPESVKKISESFAGLKEWDPNWAEYLVIEGFEDNSLYDPHHEILFVKKGENRVVTFTELTRLKYRYDTQRMYFLTYPKYT